MNEIKRKPDSKLISRRTFLSVQWALFGSITLAPTRGQPGATGGDGPGKAENPFAYRTDQFERTDPKLVGYTEQHRFKCPCAEPRRIAISPDQSIYIAGEKKICVVGPNGSVISEYKLDEPPQCVTVGLDRTFYVGFVTHVESFEPNGVRRARWQTPAGRPFLTGLAILGNELLVADSGNRIVWRYDLTGRITGSLGDKGQNRGSSGFVLPSPNLDVEVGPDGLIYANNPGRHRVECYTAQGQRKSWWGKPSAAIDGFCGCCNPISIALLPDGRVLTCEKGLPRVKVYNPNGVLDCVVAGPELFRENLRAGAGRTSDLAMVGLDAVADAQGRVYVLDRVTGDILVMAPKKSKKSTSTEEKASH